MFLTLASIRFAHPRNPSWTSTGTIRARKRSMHMAKRTFAGLSMLPNKCSIHWQNTFRYAFILDDRQRTSDCVFQGPCPQNQLALANSRLWDAIAGFLYIFAHMQRKLSQVPFPFPLSSPRPAYLLNRSGSDANRIATWIDEITKRHDHHVALYAGR